MKQIFKPILIFLGIQFICALGMIILGGGVALVSPAITFFDILLPAVAWALLLADPLMLFYFWKKGWLTPFIEERHLYKKNLPTELFMWGMATICFFFIMDGILPFISFNGGEEEEWGLISQLLRHPAGILSITIFGPIAEEVLFRGIVLRDLLSRTEPSKAIAGSAFIFAVIHGNIDQFTYCLVFGAVLGYVYYRTANLYVCMGMHILNNSIVIIYSFLYPDTESLWEIIPDSLRYGILFSLSFIVLLIVFHIQSLLPGHRWKRIEENESQDAIETPE